MEPRFADWTHASLLCLPFDVRRLNNLNLWGHLHPLTNDFRRLVCQIYQLFHLCQPLIQQNFFPLPSSDLLPVFSCIHKQHEDGKSQKILPGRMHELEDFCQPSDGPNHQIDPNEDDDSSDDLSQ